MSDLMFLVKKVQFITLVLAFCSIIYELLLAHTLSSIHGNAVLRYTITIGLYLASLGAGTLLSSRHHTITKLFEVESLLAVMGLLAPIIPLFSQFLTEKYLYTSSGSFGSSLLYNLVLYSGTHFMIIVIGVLSGYELPLLIHYYREHKNTKTGITLAWDYIGTLFGAILFPVIFLPKFGLFGIGAITAIVNGCAAIYIGFQTNKNDELLIKINVIVIIVAILLLNFNDYITKFLTDEIYLYYLTP